MPIRDLVHNLFIGHLTLKISAVRKSNAKEEAHLDIMVKVL